MRAVLKARQHWVRQGRRDKQSPADRLSTTVVAAIRALKIKIRTWRTREEQLVFLVHKATRGGGERSREHLGRWTEDLRGPLDDKDAEAQDKMPSSSGQSNLFLTFSVNS